MHSQPLLVIASQIGATGHRLGRTLRRLRSPCGGAHIVGNYVQSNQAVGNGGGILAAGGPKLDANWVLRNQTAGYGGGLAVHYFSGAVTNTVVADNRVVAGRNGSGIYIGYGSSFPAPVSHWRHTTVARNTGGDTTGIYIDGSTVWFTNTIIYSHTVGAQQAGGALNLYATLWHSNSANTGGTVNIGALNPTGDPAFVDAAGGDYHLGAGSAAADGAPFSGVTDDIDGQPRPLGFGYDFGADEFSAPRLELAKTVPGEFGAPGQTLTYTIRVTGSVEANFNTVVTDTIGDYQRLTAATPSQGSCTIHDAGYGGYATCALGAVVTTTPALITITAQVSPTVNSGGVLTNRAEVRSDGATDGPVQTSLLAQDCLARINAGVTEYTSPQAAVNAASAGDLIKLAGTCFGVSARNRMTQTLLIDKAVTLRGGYGPGAWEAADPAARPTTLNAPMSLS